MVHDTTLPPQAREPCASGVNGDPRISATPAAAQGLEPARYAVGRLGLAISAAATAPE
jgi:hypothetical protein